MVALGFRSLNLDPSPDLYPCLDRLCLLHPLEMIAQGDPPFPDDPNLQRQLLDCSSCLRHLCRHLDPCLFQHLDSRLERSQLASLLPVCQQLCRVVGRTLSAMRLADGHLAFRSAIHLAISSSVPSTIPVPSIGGGGLAHQIMYFDCDLRLTYPL